MKKKFDLEAKLFIYLLRLEEEKNKEYSVSESDYHIVYVFEDEKEFRNYFINNGCNRASDDDFLSIFKMKITKKGSIIALKGLCDYAITRDAQVNLNYSKRDVYAKKIRLYR